MGVLDTFVAPRPNRAMIAAMTRVNRVLMLKGLPLVRDIAPFNRIPGLRGLAAVRHLAFADDDRARLAAMAGPGKAVFFLPNHPEFFTDWMIDKEILSRVAPFAASWATNGVVNGMGGLAQKFWLANNLVAQIPGDSTPAKAHSIDWALQGHGVLLHPEGQVGWHGDHIAPLMPGAADMAAEAVARMAAKGLTPRVFLAPIVWKLVFLGDVRAALARECAYVERKLDVDANPADPVSKRIWAIYNKLFQRKAEHLAIAVDVNRPLGVRRLLLIGAHSDRLVGLVGPADNDADLRRKARRRERDIRNVEPDRAREIRGHLDALAKLDRLGDFAYVEPKMTQEHMAEHLKRLRTDYCKGSWRDTVNTFLPQAAAPRRALVRAPEPLAMHEFSGSATDAMALVRTRMQVALDAINAEIRGQGGFVQEPNPFHTR
ncbi:MAG: hypothetical protein IPL47_06615 [Phyllobacteriaceae bacterium]|nr:hypothetical protein [Phyllobacteriaceae bacterium]